MPVSDRELEQMKRRLALRSQERSRRLARRLAEARRDFDRIVQRIAARFHPLRIYQWGSLVDGRHFTERSDIDIALEGITEAADFFAILAEAERLTRFPVDIVQIERIHPEYADLIRSRGRIVYER
jgi:predicted nucleotidyltransferase